MKLGPWFALLGFLLAAPLLMVTFLAWFAWVMHNVVFAP